MVPNQHVFNIYNFNDVMQQSEVNAEDYLEIGERIILDNFVNTIPQPPARITARTMPAPPATPPPWHPSKPLQKLLKQCQATTFYQTQTIPCSFCGQLGYILARKWVPYNPSTE